MVREHKNLRNPALVGPYFCYISYSHGTDTLGEQCFDLKLNLYAFFWLVRKCRCGGRVCVAVRFSSRGAPDPMQRCCC